MHFILLTMLLFIKLFWYKVLLAQVRDKAQRKGGRGSQKFVDIILNSANWWRAFIKGKRSLENWIQSVQLGFSLSNNLHVWQYHLSFSYVRRFSAIYAIS